MPAKKEETKKKNVTQTQTSLKTQGMKSQKLRISEKVGLIFPVARVLRLMKKKRIADRISPKCAIGVAAVLEYLAAEVLEMAGDVACQPDSESQHMIKPRHICLAVKSDAEMVEAIGSHVIIPMGGVIPHIEDVLEKKKRRSKNVNKATENLKDDQAKEDDDEDEDEEDEEEEDDEEDDEDEETEE
ncbi:hypothetical protein SteCoe_16276 [Stentor coeruleus]|uniref:Histone H2A n=1 Tax=Stentor coeruleus TaxID=5963 RepID=A0A1R2C1H2_9CILI|nr:hypothetical protein SteCoe_16276 [Stentor coeruleus]